MKKKRRIMVTYLEVAIVSNVIKWEKAHFFLSLSFILKYFGNLIHRNGFFFLSFLKTITVSFSLLPKCY